jgi:hypothetical protein
MAFTGVFVKPTSYYTCCRDAEWYDSAASLLILRIISFARVCTCLWLKWFASYKTREGSTGVQKFEWLCWLAAMTSENVRSCKATMNSHFCCLLVFSKQLKESTCWALLLSKLPDRRLITPILVVLMYNNLIKMMIRTCFDCHGICD